MTYMFEFRLPHIKEEDSAKELARFKGVSFHSPPLLALLAPAVSIKCCVSKC